MISQAISSNLNDRHLACPNSRVIFTCTAPNSRGIAWTSDEYIGGSGAQLEVSADDHQEGSRINSTVIPTTHVIVTRNDQQVLEAQLYVVASAASTVKCRNVLNDIADSVSFQLAGKIFKLSTV